ncbi:Protein DPCD [Blattella germanica]|nr:Protein DPCD [Blattella germanica]
MADKWLDLLLNAEKRCIIEDEKRKILYRFPQGEEMAEEYSMQTDVLLRRAWRKKSNLRGDGQWEVEIGDPEPQFLNLDQVGIKESMTAEPENKCITVRTSNKKYFKKLPIPELERIGLVPEQDKIQFSHRHNTLIISYQKPLELFGLEKKVLEELKKVKTTKEGDLQCNPS